jgi:hypothetical protein
MSERDFQYEKVCNLARLFVVECERIYGEKFEAECERDSLAVKIARLADSTLQSVD